jgi:methylated-DNA-[protein]-cysteine S-methyltransferase
LISPQISQFTSRIGSSPIGIIEVLASNVGLSQVNLLGLHGSSSEFSLPESDLTRQALRQILEYLDGKRRVFDLLIDWAGLTLFHREVLTCTMAIAFGEVRTYGQLAQALGKPAAASRAIGGAMARNPLPIVIPCHRVVAADGRLTGYSAADGIQTKRWLLELEGHQVVGEKLA